ncbi:NUDIX hydrolase [Candidatus Microgenomates bacterium]|nr:MAG: NUDIX hydrolase [Candidatus Microgenomates bacterium]
MQPLQITSVIVVLKCQNKFLLVQRNENDDIFPGKWQNMGGKIELGETVEKAIKREVEEEIGLKVDSHPVFLQSYSWKKDEDSPVRLGLIFLINLEGKQDDYKIQLDEELSNFAWVDLKEAEEMNTEDKLIGKDSPTGTFGQLSQVKVLQQLYV